MIILMFADKSETGLRQKIEKPFAEKGVKKEDLTLPPALIKTEAMIYYLIKTTL